MRSLGHCLARVFVGALVPVFLAGSGLADAAHPNKEKGFDPDRVYDFHAIDNVNTYNGNLVLTIPIGQRYAVNANLSYGFSLVYNGMIWDATGDNPDNPHPEYIKALTSVRSNAGNGWIVSLGRLFAPKDPQNQTLATNGNEWIYETVDGRDHSFGLPTLDTAPTLSNDDDLIRMIRESDTKRRIEFPDGSTSVFQNYGTDETIGPWRLVQMHDRFGNNVYVQYEFLQTPADAPTKHADGNKYKYNEQWIVNQYANGDGPDVGMPIRTQRLYFHNIPKNDPLYGTTFGQTLLREADLSAFTGTTAYLFDYQRDAIKRPDWDRSKLTSNGYTWDDSDVDLYDLNKMTLDATGESFGFHYFLTQSDNLQGSIDRLQYPTGGGIRWTCSNLNFLPSWKIGGADQQPGTSSPQIVYRDQNIAVVERTLFDENGNDIVAADGKTMTWTYSRGYTKSIDIPISGTNNHNIFNHEMAVAVVDPEGTANITYYSIYNPTGADSYPIEWETVYGWDVAEFAMPITHWLNQPLHDGNNAGLSSEVRQNFTGFGFMDKDNPRAGGTSDASPDTFRTTFVRYKHEGVMRKQEAARHTSFDQDKTCTSANVVCFSESFNSSPLLFTTARICRSTQCVGGQTVFIRYQQGGTYANFTAGDQPSIDSNTRTTFTKYNPPTDSIWLTGTYTEQCVSDGDAAGQDLSGCAAVTGTHKSLQTFCFDTSTGFLKRRRTQRDLQPQPDDVVAEFTSEQTPAERETGNVAKEQDFGAANGDVPTGTDLCTMTLGTAAYTINNTYAYGVLSKTQYGGTSFYSLNIDVDAGTGLTIRSRDTSDIATEYTYDGGGRMTRLSTPGSVAMTYTYHPFDSSAHTTPWIEAVQDAGATLGKTDTIFNFDALGRLVLQRNLNWDETTSAKRTRYDALSRKIEVSALEKYTGDPFTPAHVSSMAYDHFDRVRQTTALDGSVTKTEYAGEGTHRLTRTASIYTGNSQTAPIGDPVNTIEENNAQGKLLYVKEPSGPAGEDVKTYYGYDIADRLTSVDMNGVEVTQQRRFVYDNRGFLLSETHPEIGKFGKGTVTYGKPLSTTGYTRYDARGHALRKTEGADYSNFDLELVYDGAERLRQVNHLTTGTAEPIKSFLYGEDNVGSNYKKGKLEQAVRHNRIDVGDTVVTETYTYNTDSDAGGRITRRDTSVQLGTAEPFQSFTQNFTYSPWGQVANHTYPTCVLKDCTPPAGFVQTLSRTFHNGQLVRLSDQSSDWATFEYAPNGFLNKITHVTASGDRSQVDEQVPDGSGIPRPLEIKFKGYCVGPPINAGEPSDQLIANNKSTTLSVTPPAGAANPTYQWYQGLSGDRSNKINAATGNTFTTPLLTQTTDYWVEVRDGSCPSESRTAHITVKPCDSVYIVEQPHDTFIAGATDSVSYSVETSDAGAHYQWYQRDDLGVDTMVGTDSKTLTVNGLTSASSFWVRVFSADRVCSVDSRIALAKVCANVTVTVTPQSQTVLANTTARISAAATGPLPLTFTWTSGTTSVVHSAPDGTDTLETDVTTAPQTWTLKVSSDCGKSVTVSDFTLTPKLCQVTQMRMMGDPPNIQIAHAGEGAHVSVIMDPPDSDDPDNPSYKYEWFPNDLQNPVYFGRDTVITTSKPWSSFYVKVTDLRCKNSLTPDQYPVVYSKKFYVYVYGSCAIGNVSITAPVTDVPRGGSVTLTAVAEFPVHMTYQWYKGQSGDTRTPIQSVADHPDQVIADYRPSYYWVRMTNSCGVYKDSAAVAIGVKDTNPDNTPFVCSAINIDQQPVGARIAAGESRTLSVDATAVPLPLFYTWNEGATPIANGKSFVTVTPAKSAIYTADITTTCSATTKSLPALLQVVSCGTNGVTTQPASGIVAINHTATLTVAVSSPADVVTYQWYSGALPDTSAPVGTNSPTFTTPALTLAASYWVRMTTASGCTFDSDTALLDICIPPTIRDNYSRDVHIIPGQYQSIGVDTDGTHVHYDWFIGTSNDDTSHPEGEHTNLIEIHPDVTTSYWVRVTNDCGIAKSLPILVSVCPTAAAPTAAKSPLMPGNTTTVSIPPMGGDIRYQWYTGEPGDTTHPIANSNTPSVTTPPVTVDTKFWVRVTSGTCFADSETVTVAICHEPAIIWQGSDAMTKRGQQVSLGVIVSPVTDTTMTYYSGPTSGDIANSTVVNGPTVNQGIFVSPTVTTKYWARAAQPTGCYADTQILTVDVCVPTIRTQPQDAMVNGTTPATLTVVADDAVSYQWYEGDSGAVQVPVPNATSATLSISPTVAKKYWCEVKGTCGVPTNSVAANVTICSPPTITGGAYTVSISNGQSTQISINTSGTNPQIHWYQGLVGDTSTPLAPTTNIITIAPVTTTKYWAQVTNTCGSVSSAQITVDVCNPVTITTQPHSVTINSGGTTTLSVVASTSPGTVTYQWFEGSTPETWSAISNATSASFTTPALTADTTYWVRVTRGACSIDSQIASVTVCNLTAAVADAVSRSGDTVTLSAGVSGNHPDAAVSYTWYQGNAGDTSHAISSAQNILVSPTTTTKYWVRVSDGTCTVDSNVATVSTCIPKITTQPQNALVNPGATVTLSVVATGDNLSYQWYQGSGTGTPVGTNSNTFTSPPLTSATSYWVHVTGCYPLDSAVASISICQPATATTPYTFFQIQSGQSATLGVTVAGTSPTLQWYQGTSGNTSTPLSGKTTTPITVSPASTTQYWARASNQCANGDGPTITVDVCTIPTITTQPADVSVPLNGTTVLSVAASTSPGTVTYQWYRGASGDMSAPVGTNSSSFTTPAITADTQYWVRVTRGACSVNSNAATVYACNLLVSLGSVQSKSGQAATLTASIANARAAATYTWYRGNSGDTSSPITNVSGPTIVQSPVTSTNYWVRVTDGICTVNSNTATIQTCIPNITSNPAGVTINSGQQATLTVVATGDGLSYQWYEGAVGLMTTPVGTNSSTFTVQPATTKTYWVKVTGCQSANSTAATVTICAPATATTGSTLYQSTAYQNVLIGVTVSGNPAPTIQWYQGTSGNTATPLSGKTTNTITVAPAVPTQYWARATNQCANGDSPTITVDACSPPTITVQPATVAVNYNSSATLSVTATATGVITYQWYSGAQGDTSSPVGTNSSTFTTPPMTADTQYWVRLTRGLCTTDSNAATVYACYLAASVNNVQTKSGVAASLTASVGNQRVSPSYAWYRGNSGDTSNPLNLFGSGITQTVTASTNYWVRVTDGTCTVNSNTATIQVCVPNIISNPASVTIPSGQQTTLTVVATGENLSYQWYIGSAGVTTTPVGTNSPSLTVQPASTTGYWVKVTGCQTANSTAATVTICQVPAITSIVGSTAQPNTTTAVAVNATGTGLNYQWYQGLAGDTSHPVFTNTRNPTFTAIQSAYYWVRVSNTCGSVDSSAVMSSVYAQIYNFLPGSTVVPYGGYVTESLSASGTYLTYQWYLNDGSHPIAGATSPSYTTPALTQNASYFCAVTSGFAVTYSPWAEVTICTPPQLDSAYTQAASPGCWYVVAAVNGNDAGNVNYTWYRGQSGDTSSIVQGFTGNYMTVCPTVTTSYWCRIWFNDGSCYKDTQTLTVH